jgi:hypothetical protein
MSAIMRSDTVAASFEPFPREAPARVAVLPAAPQRRVGLVFVA